MCSKENKQVRPVKVLVIIPIRVDTQTDDGVAVVFKGFLEHVLSFKGDS